MFHAAMFRAMTERHRIARFAGRSVARSVPALVVVGLSISCASPRRPAPTSTPAPTAGSTASLARAAGPPRYVTGYSVYEITTVGTVSSPTDSTSHPDTIKTTATLTYDARRQGADALVSGNVVSRITAVTAGLRGSGTTTTSAPVPFRARVDTVTGVVRYDDDTSAATGCSARGPTADQARELATSRPRSLATGASWQDTLSSKSCLGGVPLTSRAARSFAVANASATDPVSGGHAILVTHTSAATMDGGGPRNGRLITLSGSGSGTTEQYFDRTTGVLLSAHTVATLDLDVGVNGRLQRLHQHAEWQARLAEHRSQ